MIIITWPQIIILFLLLSMILFKQPVLKVANSLFDVVAKNVAFYVTWTVVIAILISNILSPWNILKTDKGFVIFLLFIGILLLPSLKSLNIMNVFKVELRELNEAVQKLHETVLNLNIRSTQNVNITTLETPYGRKEKLNISTQSEDYSQTAYSLFLQGRYLQAIQFYHKALDLDCNNWMAAFYLGFLYLSLKDFNVDPESWGFDDEERLSRAIFFSQIAAQKGTISFMPFLNLGIAQQHLGGDRLMKLAFKNLEMAYNILHSDPTVPTSPRLMMEKGKARSFMGLVCEYLDKKEDAIKYRTEALEIFENCPSPQPPELKRWKEDAENALKKLNKS